MRQRRTILAGKCPRQDNDPMPESGIYIVTLTNRHPISVNAQNRTLAERCISVTSANCKVGMARSFRVRERNYWRTFGQQHVTLHPIALMPDSPDRRARDTRGTQGRAYSRPIRTAHRMAGGHFRCRCRADCRRRHAFGPTALFPRTNLELHCAGRTRANASS